MHDVQREFGPRTVRGLILFLPVNRENTIEQSRLRAGSEPRGCQVRIIYLLFYCRHQILEEKMDFFCLAAGLGKFHFLDPVDPVLTKAYYVIYLKMPEYQRIDCTLSVYCNFQVVVSGVSGQSQSRFQGFSRLRVSEELESPGYKGAYRFMSSSEPHGFSGRRKIR